jgi:hypothetical protein
MQSDQDTNLFDIFQRGIELVKAADEKITDQAIEKTRVRLENNRKPIT